MKKLVLFLLAALPALALDNSVIIQDKWDTGTLTNHPFVFSRVFAKGELPNFCRPYATPSDTGIRATIPEWHCDVKVRWRDGTRARAIADVRTSSPSWTVGGGAGGWTTFQAVGDKFRLVTTNPHNLSAGDALSITGSPTDSTLISDAYFVTDVVSSTEVQWIYRGGVSSFGGTYTISQDIDPNNRAGLRFRSNSHNFRKGEDVVCSGISGVAAANGTFRVTAVTRDEFVVNASGAGAYESGGTCTGPEDGSVKQAIVLFKASIPDGGYAKVDWVNDPNPSYVGDMAATRAAGFTKASALAATWGLQVDLTAPVAPGHTATYSANARDILNDWNGVESHCGLRWWILGPIESRLEVEQNCPASLTAATTVSGSTTPSAYDIGWRAAGTENPVCSLTMAIATTAQNQFTVSCADEVVEGSSKLWFKISDSTAAPRNELMLVDTVDSNTTVCNGQTITIGQLCLTVTRGVDGSSLGTSATPGNFVSGKVFGVYQWRDGTSAHKSLHPMFELRFINGWSGVGERVEIQNMGMRAWQNLWYSMTLKTGAGLATRMFRDTFKHVSATRWKKTVWDGDDPEFYCKDQGTDPEKCAGVVQQRSDGSLVSISVTSNLATVTCSPTCGAVANGNAVRVTGEVGDKDLNKDYIVSNATSTTYQFTTSKVANGTYADINLKIYRGTRARKYRIDHNTPYLIYTGIFPQWNLYSGQTTDNWAIGFSKSDRGEIGPRRPGYQAGGEWFGNYLGLGTWGTNTLGDDDGIPVTDFPNGTQESAIWEASEAKWFQNWDLGGYEFTFGDTVPGGGGNAEVQSHQPRHFMEDDAAINRIYFAGFPDLGYGREVSFYGRPTLHGQGSNYAANNFSLVDRAKTVISASVGAVPITSTVPNASLYTTYQGVVGQDVWGMETAHQNDRYTTAYLITGDYSLLREILFQATWQCAVFSSRVPTEAARPECMVQPTGASHLRFESSPYRNVFRAAMLYPNQPQWGQTTTPVESFYYNKLQWDLMLAKEGFMEVTSGWNSILYPNIAQNCAGWTIKDPSPWRWLACASNFRNNRPNPLGYPSDFGPAVSCGSYIDCNWLGTGDTSPPSGVSWMFTQVSNDWAMSEQQGEDYLDPARYVRRKLARLQLNIAGNEGINQYLTATYTTPPNVDPSGNFLTSMAQYHDWYADSWTYPPQTIFKEGAMALNSFNYINGSSWADAINYPAQWLGATSFMIGLDGNDVTGCAPGDRYVDGCTGKNINKFFYDNVVTPGIIDMDFFNKFDYRPRQNITNLSAMPSGSNVTIQYDPPPTAAATMDECTYRLSQAPPSDTFDANDVSDGQTSTATRTLNLGPLAPGLWYFRLTCGQRLASFTELDAATPVRGTNRRVTTFTIGSAPSTPSFSGNATNSGNVTVK